MKNIYQDDYYRFIANSWIKDTNWHEATWEFFKYLKITHDLDLNYDNCIDSLSTPKLNKFFMVQAGKVKAIYGMQRTRCVFGTYCPKLNEYLHSKNDLSVDDVVEALKKFKFKCKSKSTVKRDGSSHKYWAKKRIGKERDRSAGWSNTK